jgi:DNA mismatch repair protein MutL
LGFRGEALPSIGSVSKISITSSRDESGLGNIIRCQFGQKIELMPAASAKGTAVRVESLFTNVPARKKFLKTFAAEFRAIRTLSEDMALSFSNVAFQLVHDGENIFRYAAGSTFQRWSEMIAPEVYSHVFPLDHAEESIRIHGLISRPDFVRKDHSQLRCFVNGRPVSSPELSGAILQYYRDKIPKGNFPYAWLFVSLPAEMFDVNVHPTKKEIRFRTPSLVISAILQACEKALATTNKPPPAYSSTDMPKVALKPNLPPILSPRAKVDKEQSPTIVLPQPSEKPSPKNIQPVISTIQPENNPSIPKVIGQLNNLYIIIQTDQGMQLIDQHAAHERILYNKLKSEAKTGHSHQQPLLIPDLISLAKDDLDVLQDQFTIIETLGFQVTVFGKETLKVDAIPAGWETIDLASFFKTYVSIIHNSAANPDITPYERLFRAACRSAVKAGDFLTIQEMTTLVSTLYQTENPYTCPHGRPVIKIWSWNELRSFFNRTR